MQCTRKRCWRQGSAENTKRGARHAIWKTRRAGRGGENGVCSRLGLTRASRRPGRHGGHAAGFLQSSWGSPGLLTGAKGVSQSTGHVALSATYFPRGTGWQRPSHSCQGYAFSFPGGTWSRLACRLFEYLSSVILRRAVTHAEKGRNWALDAPDSSASPVVSVIPLPHGCQKDLCSLLISCFFLFRKGCAPSQELSKTCVSIKNSPLIPGYPASPLPEYQNMVKSRWVA